MSDIIVFFRNNRSVRLPDDKVIIADGEPLNVVERIRNGETVVNWGNVCFIQRAREPEDEDDE